MALAAVEIKRLRWARARGLAQLGQRIGDIRTVIDEMLRQKPLVRVLELGFGFGKVLMELKAEYGNRIELYGLSRTSKHGDWPDIKRVAIEDGIFTAKEMKKIPKPKLKFGDIDKGIPFSANYFDFIFGQVTFFYYKDKSAVLEEINRVLNPQGVARIDVNLGMKAWPSKYAPCLEIWDNGKEISFWSYIKKFKSLKEKKGKLRPYLEMTKVKKLKLGLKLVHCFDLNKFCKDWWGVKSIYQVK